MSRTILRRLIATLALAAVFAAGPALAAPASHPDSRDDTGTHRAAWFSVEDLVPFLVSFWQRFGGAYSGAKIEGDGANLTSPEPEGDGGFDSGSKIEGDGVTDAGGNLIL